MIELTHIPLEPVMQIDDACIPFLVQKLSELTNGMWIMDENEIQDIREEWEITHSESVLFSQKGGQTDMLSSSADISIVGGGRGGGKSYILLMNALYDITNPNFRAIIFRKDLDDLTDLIDTSNSIYSDYGLYNRAKNDMTWNFFNSGWLTFSYHNMDSWVAKFIEWWIDQETGLPIPERCGVVRYCFMDGDDVSMIVWGDTREEVFEKCKDTLMSYWKPEYERYGDPKELLIKSVTFIPAKLADNVALMSSDPSYLANLIGQDDETRARFLDGNWKYKAAGYDLVKIEHMERFYDNAEQTGDGIRRVTCDAALDGGDKCVFYLWIGNHIADIAVCSKDSKKTLEFAKGLLERWRVREDNFAYDLIGVGQLFKGFLPKAIPFNAKEAVKEEFKGMYFNLKAQSFQYFADHIKDGTYSIAPDLLERRFSGKGYKNKMLREILNEERRCIRFREDDPTRVIDKTREMKRLIHRSPDFIEGAAIREVFNIKNVHHKPKNMGLLGGTPNMSKRQSRRYNPFAGNYQNINSGRRW